ncbi:UNVERIFIED_CONTAM: hypothetical protein Scaly_0627400 [Sesamum calycinum]|uniref:3'-5' exonuclease domain-containing protein n=1 Tax=Sesamum calycinum TaxID=2727403 RepID=A0AAW2RVD5_9LAMI
MLNGVHNSAVLIAVLTMSPPFNSVLPSLASFSKFSTLQKSHVDSKNFLQTLNTFVGVGVKHDARRLWNDWGLEVSNMRDLRSWAAKELDDKELRGAGLKDLAREVLGEDMNKPLDVTLSRWDNRLLSRCQVAYACLDAYISFEIGRRLSAWY